MSVVTSITSKVMLSLAQRTHRLSSLCFYRLLSSSSTPYPLYYELIHHRPPPRTRTHSKPDNSQFEPDPDMDRSKRKYYRKRARRMFGGSDSDPDPDKKNADEFVELKPEIVDFPRLHAREQELYFYDAFAFPWEKDKHYRMVYQLEKKYFPQQSLDKAFVDESGEEPVRNTENERGLVFFDEGEEKVKDENQVKEFFKCLKKFPNGGGGGKRRDVSVAAVTQVGEEPFLVSRRTELPPRWDGPSGTMVLVDKPKGWTSFTVCGKLRRLVKVQKVGHAGTLDPMATGLLIVCVGKATKVVDRQILVLECTKNMRTAKKGRYQEPKLMHKLNKNASQPHTRP